MRQPLGCLLSSAGDHESHAKVLLIAHGGLPLAFVAALLGVATEGFQGGPNWSLVLPFPSSIHLFCWPATSPTSGALGRMHIMKEGAGDRSPAPSWVVLAEIQPPGDVLRRSTVSAERSEGLSVGAPVKSLRWKGRLSQLRPWCGLALGGGVPFNWKQGGGVGWDTPV